MNATLRHASPAPMLGFRQAARPDAEAIHRLIVDNLEAGHLLPRTLEDVTDNIARFTVAVIDDAVIGCAELAPLSPVVAEVRSLVVTERSRGQHIGPQTGVALGGGRGGARFFHALRVYSRSGALRPSRVHDRSARLGAGKDRARLPVVRPVPSLRSICGDAPAQGGGADPTRAACGGDPRRPRGRRTPAERGAAPADPRLMRDVYTRIEGGITAPLGFRAAGVSCGIKAKGLDLAIVTSDVPASVAAVFTTNLALAAPVVVAKEHLARNGGRGSAVVINSGCANACTGADGLDHARSMARHAATALSCDPGDVLVASTGVIGVKLDMAKVERGIAEAVRSLSREGNALAARAIMTTDPFPKEAAVEVNADTGTLRVGGMAKGSGMIEPLMATMLGFVTTDAMVAPALLQRALKAACDDTFNAISVDGECSTNDCVIALANGASGVSIGEPDLPALIDALKQVCEPLAMAIVRGGEGATKLITVDVVGAASDIEARRAARAIANSPLVKTAIHGGDPNWGRLVAVAGRSGSQFVLDNAAVRIGSVRLFHDGVPHDERAPEAADYLRGKDISLEVDLGTGGTGRSRMWTCDFSAEYVRINAEYRT